MNSSELEKLAKERVERERPSLTSDDSTAIVYQLEVHRVELELQNDELRDTEAGMRAAKERFQQLYRVAPIGLITLNADDRIVEINDNARRLLRSDRDDLVGRPLSAFVASADVLEFHRHIRRAREAEDSIEARIDFELPRSGSFRGRLISVPLTEELSDHLIVAFENLEAELIPVEELGNEISAHELVQDELDLTREKFCAVVDTTSEAILLHDSAGLIEFANLAAEELFDCELVGKNIRTLLSLSADEDFDRRQVMNGVARRQDGELIPVGIKRSVHTMKRRALHTVSIRDESEQKRLHERSARLESARMLVEDAVTDLDALVGRLSKSLDLASGEFTDLDSDPAHLEQIREALRTGEEIAQRFRLAVRELPAET